MMKLTNEAMQMEKISLVLVCFECYLELDVLNRN